MSAMHTTNCRCHIIRLGGIPDPQTMGVHHTAQGAYDHWRECQALKETSADGTRYEMRVENENTGEMKTLELKGGETWDEIVRTILETRDARN